MSFAWYVYTLALMLVAALACATNASVWALLSHRKALTASVAFGCYLFELADIFFSEYQGDKLYMTGYLENGLHWPVWEMAVSVVLVTSMWACARRRSHASADKRSLAVFALAFTVVSIALAPVEGRAGKLWNMLYWSWRDLCMALCFAYPLWHAAHCDNEADRADIDRVRRFYVVALVLVAAMLVWDTGLIAFFNADSFTGLMHDFWWHATERNIPENLLMVFCAVASIAEARSRAMAFANHPADRLDDSDRARLERRVLERLPRFADTYELSRREREVLELALRECSTAQIADELFISTGTVKAHLHRIYQKVGVKNRHDLTLAFWRF